jgi:membrane-associated phospholipid phosphatase
MNDTIFYFFHGLAYRYTFFDEVVIFLAQTFPYIVLMLAGLFLLFHHEVFKANTPTEVLKEKWKEIVKVVVTVISAYALSKILKILFQALRPFERHLDIASLFQETGYAFPSGHATLFMALAFSIFFLHKKAGLVFIVFALIIGLARIVAGVHFPLDILAGFLLGALVAYLAKKI